MISKPQIGELVIVAMRLFRVLEIDRGFYTLADHEGETIIRHESSPDFHDAFLRNWARCLTDEDFFNGAAPPPLS